MEADLAKMGMSMSDFDVTYAEVPTKEDVALTTTERTVTDLGDGKYIMQDKITNIEHQYIDSVMQVPQIHPKGGPSNAGGITVTPPSSGGAGLVSGGKSSGGGGGGGGGGGSQKDKKKSSDEIERYHTIKKEIGNLSREYDNLSAAKDRAFGANRLRVMDQEAAKLEE
nr:MAG TPA: Transcription initiation factor TFIID subunit, DNA, Nuclear [Caudoviricetes sp.]